jgi:hypothetical protein
VTKGNFGEITDKWAHGYMPSYLRIAAELGPAARVCELGVYLGDSLRLWQSLFPQGQVTGVDINPSALYPDGSMQVIRRQDDPELPLILGGPFDLVVDDASHNGVATAATFTNLWPLVAPGGYYVIEDWFVGLPQFSEHPMADPDMLYAVQALLTMLDQGSDVEEITYRFGLAVVHRRQRD